jgi:hypothetical protein
MPKAIEPEDEGLQVELVGVGTGKDNYFVATCVSCDWSAKFPASGYSIVIEEYTNHHCRERETGNDYNAND